MNFTVPDPRGIRHAGPPILVIGDLASWQASGRLPPKLDGFFFIDFHDLTPSMLAAHEPAVVLSSLFGKTFDALEVARRLVEAGFRGRYRVVVEAVPAPHMIRSEVKSVAPGLDFDILLMGG